MGNHPNHSPRWLNPLKRPKLNPSPRSTTKRPVNHLVTLLLLLVKRKTMAAETELKTTKEGVRTKCPLLTIGTQKLQRKKKVIPTENIKAEVEVVEAAEADAEIVVDIEAEEVTEAVVVRTAAATVKTAEVTAEATPGAVAVIEMVAE